MKVAQGKIGRVFVIKLEDGDVVPECIEKFSAEKGISVGYAVFVGGMAKGNVIVGPRETSAIRPDPISMSVDDAHEASAIGVLAPTAEGKPVLHMLS